MTKLGAELGITATGLTNICKKHNIPRPAQGYWQRVALGKTELVTPLSEEANPNLIVKIAATPKTLPEDYSDKTRERLAFEALHPLHVSEELTTLHPLVLATRDGFKDSSDSYRHTDLVFPHGSETLDISVAPGSVTRALRIWNALLRGVQERELTIRLEAPSQYHSTTILTIDGYRFELKMREKQRQISIEPGSSARSDQSDKKLIGLKGTGLLCFKIKREKWGWPEKEFKENGKGKCWETSLNWFFEELYKMVDKLHKDEAAAVVRERKLQLQREQAAIARQAAEAEECKVQDLLTMVANWDTSKRIRAFVDDVLVRSDLPKLELDESISWMLLQADKLDPLSRAR